MFEKISPQKAQELQQQNPVFGSDAPLPEDLAAALAQFDTTSEGDPNLPTRRMTKAEAIEHEKEHQRTQVRERLAALRVERQANVNQGYEDHVRQVDEQIDLYEKKLAAIK